MENPEERKFQVKFTKKSIVKAINLFPERHHKLTLSNLDLLSGRFPVTYLYLYHRPLINNFSSTVESLKISLAKTLSFYYPFAGRIVEDPDTNEPLIICDNTGALLVEAQANIPLKKLDFYNFNESLNGKLVSINSDFPVQVQVTSYTCGGVSITFTFDHALGDASAFGMFLSSWSQVAQNMPISCIPDLGRNLRPRLPPTYHPCLDETFVKCTLEEIRNIPKTNILLKRLYYVEASSINKLQSLASAYGNKRTKIEAFSAYIWKTMATTIDKSHAKCKMGWLVDGRGRLNGDHGSMSNYIGNVLSVAIEEASIVEIKQGSISDVANNVHEAISKVTNQAYFLDLIDWIECHKPGLMLPKVVLGREGPALVLSSGRRFPVAELDFGFGSPVLGTVSSIIEKSGVGYMNQRPSAKGDGSWVISAILWPELAAALESDTVFEPLCASHLQI
ncbi:anthranilate N-benzoyltransferase protein 1 [Durio zibethinus]|uniref:Anthranilate N-benzoyltransferase protein 1 n=1 Tax=Durio zibethinus TaxID=66656 RepID=A0A6P5Y8Q3_DURZI|nr:anthranilate N-benzoyltransferase protein 1 [Durio zibethinus]